MSRLGRAARVGAVLALVILATVRSAGAQALDSSRPFEITDNSFLVEEAFNQEPGVFQNILVMGIDAANAWAATFTQEWPLFTRTHQISFSLPYASVGAETGLGDAAIHYRLQVMAGEGAAPAFSPRISLIVPSGSVRRGLGQGHNGYEINLPFSLQVRDLFVHWNAGFTHFPESDVGGVLTPRVSASGIWRVRPMINLMLEGVAEWVTLEESPSRRSRVTISPGVRTGWNFQRGEAQTIIGVGLPVVFADDGSHNAAVLLYLSYESRFRK